MGHTYRSHGCLPPCTYSHSVSKVPQVLFQRRHLSVHQPTLWPSKSSLDIHQHSKGSKTDGLTSRNQTSPVPRQLVDLHPLRMGMQGADRTVTKACEGFRLHSKPQEVRTLSLTQVRLSRIPLFTRFGSCEAHARQVDAYETFSVAS